MVDKGSQVIDTNDDDQDTQIITKDCPEFAKRISEIIMKYSQLEILTQDSTYQYINTHTDHLLRQRLNREAVVAEGNYKRGIATIRQVQERVHAWIKRTQYSNGIIIINIYSLFWYN